ncbi:acyltransferase [Saccharopolyspora sp. TS4A08]|uniref:Acyltransferase n=1 Tax=Saccharopolyspora ipomoeae TaxID=3042027 RepID=A0ABT6PP32_9PSEU|nr:acyltransferase [Saccharopolyspora sp. TS4A08]MDI2029774.1 acyltransferase [Saccharopolyspora sp. TS4A08]
MQELTTAAPTRRSTRKVSWDVVRTACVVLVMLYHATHMSTVTHPELSPRVLTFPYQVGASLLLVISAYFAAATIGRGSLRRYWWKRMARLVPPFVGAVVLIWLVLRFLRPPAWIEPSGADLVHHLLMLWNWKPLEYAFLDGSHWTVPLQLMGFTFAALLFATKWGHGNKIVWVMWTAVLLPLAQWHLRISGVPETYRMLVDGFGAHRWHLFVAGVAIWMVSTGRLGRGHFALLLAACMGAQAVHNYIRLPDGALDCDWGSTIAVWIGLLVLTLVACGPDWPLPPAAARAATWFAGISYGVFLSHQTIGYVLLHYLDVSGVPPLLQTLAVLVTGTAVGWALTEVVERPAHDFLIGLYDRTFAESGSRQSG